MANRKPLIKILPDSVFHQLWNASMQFSSLDDYIHAFTSPTSKDKIHFTKYEIDDLLSYELLKTIWNAAKLSFKDILSNSGMKKSEFSHFFCIPIRTLEDWYAGKSQCPAYMRLMFLRFFHISYLPPRVTLSTLAEKKQLRKSNKKDKSTKEKISLSSKSVLDIDNDDDFIDFLNSSVSKAKVPTSDSSSASQILSRTDYLDEILKR